jgi:hypothetical protein
VSPASDTPAGSAPDNTLHFTAPLLPLALNEAVYGCCKSPIGSCDVSMDSVVPGELGLVVGPGGGAGFELGVGFVACRTNALPPPHANSAQQQSTATANADTHRVPRTRGMANCHIHRPVKPTQRAIRLTPLAKPPQVSNVTWHAPQRSLNSRGRALATLRVRFQRRHKLLHALRHHACSATSRPPVSQVTAQC